MMQSVLGSWEGVRRLLPPLLIPSRAPHGFTQDTIIVLTETRRRRRAIEAGGRA